MATVAKRRFIRADGPDKVTGSGRYTADLTLTGMLHAKFKFAGVTHGRITRLDTSKAEALPGVFAVATHKDVPDVLYGDFVQDRYLFAQGVRALRGRGRGRRGGAHARDRRSGGRPDRGRLRAAAGRQRPRGGARPRRAARARRLGLLRRHRRHGARRQRRLPLDDRQGRRRAGHEGRRPRDQEPLRRRRLARRRRSSRARSWRSGRATTSRSGRRRRCRSTRAAASWTRSSCPPARCASSCRCWAAASAASAASTTSRTSPCSRARPRGPSASCSRAARSSSLPTSAARAWSSRSRAA